MEQTDNGSIPMMARATELTRTGVISSKGLSKSKGFGTCEIGISAIISRREQEECGAISRVVYLTLALHGP